MEGHCELLRRRRRRAGEPGCRLVLPRAQGGGEADPEPRRLLARGDGGGLTTSGAREIRAGISPEALREPALVLAAAGIEHRVELAPDGRLLGPGLGTWLVLLAGAGGNALNAWVHVAHHTSIGASTAVFGALGILGGLQFGRLRGRRRAWLALAATLALLALVGSDERT